MSEPSLILFDEPSIGLAAKLVSLFFEMIIKINAELGATILLVEQNAKKACEISSSAKVLENGKFVLEGKG